MGHLRIDTGSQAYSQVKARSAWVPLAEQDIGPLPPIADPVCRRWPDRDFRFFRETHFPTCLRWTGRPTTSA